MSLSSPTSLKFHHSFITTHRSLAQSNPLIDYIPSQSRKVQPRLLTDSLIRLFLYKSDPLWSERLGDRAIHLIDQIEEKYSSGPSLDLLRSSLLASLLACLWPDSISRGATRSITRRLWTISRRLLRVPRSYALLCWTLWVPNCRLLTEARRSLNLREMVWLF